MQTKKQHVVVLGAGESGIGAAMLAQKMGHSVFVSDAGTIGKEVEQTLAELGLPFESGAHTQTLVLAAQTIVKSPGIPNSAAIIQQAFAQNIEVISEIEFASRYTEKPLIAITGTNGKTTTTLLTYELLRQEMGDRVALGGNVGTSFARLVCEDYRYDWYVLEISSFQLDDCTSFRPKVAAILNITPDHLDRYDKNFSAYAAAKFKIAAFQQSNDYLVLNADDTGIQQEKSKSDWSSKTIVLDAPTTADGIWVDRVNYVLGTNLMGPHNWQNAKFAIRMARLVGCSAEAILQGLKAFRNAPHRLELVAEINDVQFINDSKATNVEATQYALQAPNRPIVWIVGGQDKGNDYQPIMALVSEHVKAIVCLGADNYKLMETFQPLEKVMVETKTAKDAVQTARHLAEAGDTVLLSPACASFDLFKNYIDRGDQFKAAVQELINGNQKMSSQCL